MSQPQHDVFENRRQFQLERMILFSDAVFAIAITLLVIEIKVPLITEVGQINSHELGEHLFHLIPQFIGFIMSFFVVGLFWTTHHRIFGYVVNYDGGLIWLNLVLLMTVAFLPFTTSLTSEFGYLNLAFAIYSTNLGFIGLMSFFVWLRISNPKRKLSVGLEDKRIRQYGRVRSFTIACIFFLGAILMIPDVELISWIGRFIFFLIFPAISILKRLYKMKE